jgi:TP901 family phage tail tape measure protein
MTAGSNIGGGGVRAGGAYVAIGGDINPLIAMLRLGNSKLKQFSDTINGVGKAFMIGGGILAAPLLAAVKSGARFDMSMSEVIAITQATGSAIDSLRGKALQLGRETSFTATEAAQGMKFLAMAGFTTEQILAGLPATLNLARAGMLELGEAADIASDISTAFQISADKIEMVADIIAATASNANTSVRGMSEAMKYVAPIGKAAGQSLQTVSAAIGLVSNAGIKGTMAGTSLAIVLTKLAKTETQDRLREIGVESIDAEGNIRNLVDVLQELGARTKYMSGAKRLQIFGELFDQRGMKAAINIADASAESVDRLREKIAAFAGESRRMAREMENNLGGAWTIMMSALDGLKQSISDILSGPAREWVESGTKWLGSITSFVNGNKSLIIVLAKVSATLLATGAAFLAVGMSAKLLSGIVSVSGILGGGLLSLIGVLSSVNAAMFGLAYSTIPDVIAKLRSLVVVHKSLTVALAANELKYIAGAMALKQLDGTTVGLATGGIKKLIAGLAALLGPLGAATIAAAALGYAIYKAWQYFEDRSALQETNKEIERLRTNTASMNKELLETTKAMNRGSAFSMDAANKEVESFILELKALGKTDDEITQLMKNNVNALTKQRNAVSQQPFLSDAEEQLFKGQKEESNKLAIAYQKALDNQLVAKIKTSDKMIDESRRAAEKEIEIQKELSKKQEDLYKQLAEARAQIMEKQQSFEERKIEMQSNKQFEGLLRNAPIKAASAAYNDLYQVAKQITSSQGALSQAIAEAGKAPSEAANKEIQNISDDLDKLYEQYFKFKSRMDDAGTSAQKTLTETMGSIFNQISTAGTFAGKNLAGIVGASLFAPTGIGSAMQTAINMAMGQVSSVTTPQQMLMAENIGTFSARGALGGVGSFGITRVEKQNDEQTDLLKQIAKYTGMSAKKSSAATYGG